MTRCCLCSVIVSCLWLQSSCKADLKELSEHEPAGNLDGVDLQGGATVADTALSGAGCHA